MLPAATFSPWVAEAHPRRSQHTEWIKNSALGLHHCHSLSFLFVCFLHAYNWRHYTICVVERTLKIVYLAEGVFWVALRTFQGLKKGERDDVAVQPVIFGWLSLLLGSAANGKLSSRSGCYQLVLPDTLCIHTVRVHFTDSGTDPTLGKSASYTFIGSLFSNCSPAFANYYSFFYQFYKPFLPSNRFLWGFSSV